MRAQLSCGALIFFLILAAIKGCYWLNPPGDDDPYYYCSQYEIEHNIGVCGD